MRQEEFLQFPMVYCMLAVKLVFLASFLQFEKFEPFLQHYVYKFIRPAVLYKERKHKMIMGTFRLHIHLL